MAKKEARESKENPMDESDSTHQLKEQIAELHKVSAENIRLKNVDKFSSIGRMARNIAHEIRNPLTNISLALEQLNSELPHNDDVSLLMDMISRNTMRINRLISDLIDSTKFAQLSFSHEVIIPILTEVTDAARHLAKQKNVRFDVAFSDDSSHIMLDREKIKTAFENLITHAIESVQPNEGIITVSTATENNKCVVTIESNGTAISEEKAERFFEPTFTSKQGDGLLLTQTQNIVLNHGGSIYVESKQGKGTTFTVILEYA